MSWDSNFFFFFLLFLDYFPIIVIFILLSSKNNKFKISYLFLVLHWSEPIVWNTHLRLKIFKTMILTYIKKNRKLFLIRLLDRRLKCHPVHGTIHSILASCELVNRSLKTSKEVYTLAGARAPARRSDSCSGACPLNKLSTCAVREFG